jgi:hypothetical protein
MVERKAQERVQMEVGLTIAVAAAIGGAAAAGLLGWQLVCRYLRHRRQLSWLRARALFRLRREWLEAAFVTMGSESGRPRDLVWADCEFADSVLFVRHRTTGELRALVGATISFEASPGNGGDSVEAVCAVRPATAVFCYERGVWRTDGKAVFNLSPHETIRRYRHELEVME